MWICLENPFTLNKCIILVSSKIENPTYWCVNASNDSRTVSSTVSFASPSHFKRLAYTAAKAGQVEVC
jgi:hypothetical protein